ncbi:hypothetical protein XENTR_v10003911 [Xenopus tropicalis]|nr:hypothetical protein XENTR_v10003911 [Xenopus tropicalis]
MAARVGTYFQFINVTDLPRVAVLQPQSCFSLAEQFILKTHSPPTDILLWISQQEEGDSLCFIHAKAMDLLAAMCLVHKQVYLVTLLNVDVGGQWPNTGSRVLAIGQVGFQNDTQG